MAFVFRQIYRVCVVWPWQALVALIVLCFGKEKVYADRACVFITSVLSPVTRALSYSPVRSVFSNEERFAQTLETIASVRRVVPHATVVCIEGGREKPVAALLEASDQVIHVGTNWFVRMCVESRFKSLGEIAMLLAASFVCPRRAVWYYKISGRYTLQSDTPLPFWQGNGLHGKLLRPGYMSTRAYGFLGVEFWRWRRALLSALPLALLDYPVEMLLVTYWSGSPFVHHDSLGVRGYDGTNGQPISE